MSFEKLFGKAVVAIAFVTCNWLHAQSRTHIDSLYSPSLERLKKFTIILPDHYTPPKHYPILYLLHGWGGSYQDWMAKSDIKRFVDDLPMIVVMPDAENSWYVDSATEPQNRFETYLMKDLPRALTEKYSVDTTKQAIIGISMGGYGALVLGMRHPKKFKFIGSLSGVVAAVRETENRKLIEGEKVIAPSIRAAFGEYGAEFRAAQDPFILYKNTRADLLPYIYLVIGVRDGYPTLVLRHHEFVDSLRAYNADYEYHETPGEHKWSFWDKEVPGMLKKMRKVMKF